MAEKRPKRLWRFCECEFDERTYVLTVRGRPSNLEATPLELLKQLLSSPGRTFTREELRKSVWKEAADSADAALNTAILRIREAVRAPRSPVASVEPAEISGRDRTEIIKTVHRVGYRFVAPVECITIDDTIDETPGSWKLEPGSPVPGDERWTLGQALGRGPEHSTWLAEETASTKRVEVFHFAVDETGRECLSRELQAFQLLNTHYGQSAPQPAIQYAQLEGLPFFLQAEYGGTNLRQWAEFNTLSLEDRLKVFEILADAVADVHKAGLIHNDLRPENILVAPDLLNRHSWRVRLINFRFATPLDPFSPELLTLWEESLRREETYRAGELRSFKQPSVLTDMYALGVLLYQFVCADLDDRPSPGWELRVPDPLLRQDIGQAANANSALRLNSARVLATRVGGIDQRRAEHQREAELAQRAETAERKIAVARARRPWLIAVALTLCAALVTILLFARRAVQERNVAESMNGFVFEDVLGQDDPFQSKAGSNETLRVAIENAIPEIDRRFRSEPDIAARLHQAVASALENRSQYKEADQQYEAAARLYRTVEGDRSERAVSALLMEAHMDARSNVSGALARAERVLSQQRPLLRNWSSVSPDLRIRLLATEAVVAAQGEDTAQAWKTIQDALALAAKTKNLDTAVRALLRQEVAYIDLRTGHIPEMEQNARSQIAEIRSNDGPESPRLLIPELQLMESYLLQGKNEEAIELANTLYPRFQRQFGADNDLTLQILGTRAAAEGELERWDDSIRDELAAHDLAVKRDPHSMFALGTLADVALNECRRGDWAKGESYAREAWSRLKAETNPQPGLVTGTALAFASCLLQFGDQKSSARLTEANQLLGEVHNVRYAAALTGNPGLAADFAFAQAQLAFARRDYVSAQNYVSEAEPSFQGPHADRYQSQAIARFKQRLMKATGR